MSGQQQIIPVERDIFVRWVTMAVRAFKLANPNGGFHRTSVARRGAEDVFGGVSAELVRLVGEFKTACPDIAPDEFHAANDRLNEDAIVFVDEDGKEAAE